MNDGLLLGSRTFLQLLFISISGIRILRRNTPIIAPVLPTNHATRGSLFADHGPRTMDHS